MRGDRFALGALALSTGLSVFTLSSMPRGGLAESWLASESRDSAKLTTSVQAGRRTLQALAARLASARTATPSFPSAASVFPVSERISDAPAPKPAAAFFVRRPEPVLPQPRPLVRPDGMSLISAGAGPDRILGPADSGYAAADASNGTLESFRWQTPAPPFADR